MEGGREGGRAGIRGQMINQDDQSRSQTQVKEKPEGDERGSGRCLRQLQINTFVQYGQSF